MARDNRDVILEATLHVFNEKGLKFTMDDLAKYIGMSKKTIYVAFKDKHELFLAMVDYCFDAISKQKESVLEDNSLSTKDKIRKVLGVMPENYMNIDFRQLHSLKDKYPDVYAQVAFRLESGWESIIALIEKGIAEGVIRRVSIPLIKMMLESSIAQFFARDILISNNLNYNDALDEVVGIIVDGICV